MKRLAHLKANFRDTLLLQVLFTVFFFGNAILGYFSIGNVAEVQQQGAIARNNLMLIKELLVEVLRAETGQRGYLLTANTTYATPYFDALVNIDEKIANLATARFDPEQSNRYYELQQLVELRLRELKSNYDLLEESGQQAAILGITSHRGLKQMHDINTLVATMEQHERNLLDTHTARAERRRLGALVLMLTANIVGLMLVLLSLLLARRSMHTELQYMGELQTAKQDLELKVEERTQALQHFSNELKRSNRELQDFAFVASHDLQEPLRKIRAFGDRLRQNFAEKLGEQGTDYIQRMQSAAERMSRLINDLLAFSRITTKAKPFHRISLNKVAEEVVEDLEVAIDEAGATIHFGDLPEIEADMFQMKQLFQNLLANAIKFRRPNVPPAISVSADPVDPAQPPGQQSVTIRFADNGIGFDEVFLDRIFLPFQRLHSKAEYSGTGIGLAICRRVAERHGGSLTATSSPDSGSTFIVTLARQNQLFDFQESA